MLDQINGLVRIGDLGLFLLTAILFLRWVYRANQNARQLGAIDMQFTPGWAIGGYFLPLFSLWMPYQAMREIWNASTSPAAWQSLGGHSIVRLWWGVWLAWNFTGYAVLIASASVQKGLTGSILITQISLILDASAVAAAVAALLLITRLRRIQMTRASLVAAIFE